MSSKGGRNVRARRSSSSSQSSTTRPMPALPALRPDAMEAIMGAGTVSVQGVEYGASIEGFLQGGDPSGSVAM